MSTFVSAASKVRFEKAALRYLEVVAAAPLSEKDELAPVARRVVAKHRHQAIEAVIGRGSAPSVLALLAAEPGPWAERGTPRLVARALAEIEERRR